MMADGAGYSSDARIAERRKLRSTLSAFRCMQAAERHAIVERALRGICEKTRSGKTGCGDHAVAIDNHADHARYDLLYNAWHASKAKFALYYYEVSGCEDTLQFRSVRDIYGDGSRLKKQVFMRTRARRRTYYALQGDVARVLRSGGRRDARGGVYIQIRSPFDIFPLVERYVLK